VHINNEVEFTISKVALSVTLENMSGWVFDGTTHKYSTKYNYSSIQGEIAEGEDLIVHTKTNVYRKNDDDTYTLINTLDDELGIYNAGFYEIVGDNTSWDIILGNNKQALFALSFYSYASFLSIETGSITPIYHYTGEENACF
jgi:hypothetical protein